MVGRYFIHLWGRGGCSLLRSRFLGCLCMTSQKTAAEDTRECGNGNMKMAPKHWQEWYITAVWTNSQQMQELTYIDTCMLKKWTERVKSTVNSPVRGYPRELEKVPGGSCLLTRIIAISRHPRTTWWMSAYRWLNPFTPKSDFIDFTLSNARRFYSSKGDPLAVKGLKTMSLNPFPSETHL